MSALPRSSGCERWDFLRFREAYRSFAKLYSHLEFPEGLNTEEELRVMYERSNDKTLAAFAKMYCEYLEWLL